MSTETSQYTSPVDAPPPVKTGDDQFTSPHSELTVQNGRELKSNPAFEKALDRQVSKKGPAEKEEPKEAPKKTGLFDKADAAAKAADKKEKAADPIAKANADDAAKDKKPTDAKSRAASLLDKDEDEDENDTPSLEVIKQKEAAFNAEKSKKTEGKSVKDAEDEEKAVTDAEIEEEMKTPKSQKSEQRFRELHRRWKAAEAKAADTPKQLKERDEKIATLEKQMQELATKAQQSGDLPPDIQKKLDERDMYQRRYDLENSDYVKTTFNARLTAQEEAIYTTLQTAGIKFKGMDEKQSVDLIKKNGGFRDFARKHPDVVDSVLDALNVADRKEVEAAMMGQTMLEREKKHFISTEEGKSKEYFENQKKAAEAAKANEVTPEKRKEAQTQAIEKLKSDMYEKHAFFKEAEIPADASPEEKKRLSEENTFAKEMRETLAANLTPANDDDFIQTALAATAAHKFKRENIAMKKELKQLRADLEKVRNGSRTATKGGALPATDSGKAQKPAPDFGAAIDRFAGRGSGR